MKTILGTLLAGAMTIGLAGSVGADLRVRPGQGASRASRTLLPAGEAAIRAVLEAQVAAWNRGDIDGFMKGYWSSPATTFAGSSGVKRGWQAVLDRYRHDYPGREAMGKLEFSNLEITTLSSDAALVLGHWQLERAHDRPGGVFTLIFRKFPEGWRIIHDHTSVVSSQSSVVSNPPR